MDKQKLIAWLREYQEKQRKLIFSCTLPHNSEVLAWGKIYALDDVINAIGKNNIFDVKNEMLVYSAWQEDKKRGETK